MACLVENGFDRAVGDDDGLAERTGSPTIVVVRGPMARNAIDIQRLYFCNRNIGIDGWLYEEAMNAGGRERAVWPLAFLINQAFLRHVFGYSKKPMIGRSAGA